MNFLFLTVGVTHSGKTTFGNKVCDLLGPQAKIIHVDNDVADEFIKENFNNLRTDPEILATRSPENPDLRLLVPQLIAGYALKEKYHVIATAAHPRSAIRRSYYDIAKKNGAEIVLLIFKISEEKLTSRIEDHKRSTHILYEGGTSFHDVLKRQQSVFEEPTEDEKQGCFKVFEIDESNFDDAINEVVDLARNNS